MNSSANPAQFWLKWARLAVLFSRQLLNSSKDFFLVLTFQFSFIFLNRNPFRSMPENFCHLIFKLQVVWRCQNLCIRQRFISSTFPSVDFQLVEQLESRMLHYQRPEQMRYMGQSKGASFNYGDKTRQVSTKQVVLEISANINKGRCLE